MVAQTNANGDMSDPVVLTVYKEIIDTLRWEKEERQTMTPKQIVKDRIALKRLLIGASAGPFSCVVGNIIASYYLGAELDTAGITDSVSQLKAVGESLRMMKMQLIKSTECGAQCVVSRLLFGRHTVGCQMGTKADSNPGAMSPYNLSLHHRRPLETVRE